MPFLSIISGRPKREELRLPLDRDIVFGHDLTCKVGMETLIFSRVRYIVNMIVDDRPNAKPTQLAMRDRLTFGTIQFGVFHGRELILKW